MERADFKRWFDEIGAPEDIEFIYKHNGNDVWNNSGTLQRHTNYEFYIRTPQHLNFCLVMKMHVSTNSKIEEKLTADYTRWAKQVWKTKQLESKLAV